MGRRSLSAPKPARPRASSAEALAAKEQGGRIPLLWHSRPGPAKGGSSPGEHARGWGVGGRGATTAAHNGPWVREA